MNTRKFFMQLVWLVNVVIFTVDLGGLVGENSVVFKSLLILMTSLYVVFVVPKKWQLHRNVGPLYLIIVYLGFAVLSSIWSSNPLMTLAFSFHLIAIVGLSVCSGYSNVDLVWPSCIAFGMVVLASYIMLVIAPDFAIKLLDEKPRFGGLSHPNTLANIALVLWVFVHFEYRKGAVVGFLLLILGGATIVLAQSRTAFIVYVIIIGFILFEDIKNSYVNSRVSRKNVVTIYFPCVSALLILYVGYSLGFLGLSGVRTEGISNLTGRLEIWSYYLAEMEHSWLLGGGFGAYTRDMEIGSGTITGAHNSFVEAASTLGIIGLMLYVAVFISTIKFLWLSAGRIQQRSYGYTLVIMFFIFSMLGTSFAGAFSWMHVLVFSLISTEISRNKMLSLQAGGSAPRKISK